jgi:hypothetical protein
LACKQNIYGSDEELLDEVMNQMILNEEEKEILIYKYAIENFLAEKSKVLKDGIPKYREVTQELMNRKLLEIAETKEYKHLMLKVFEYLYNKYWMIWRNRCNEIIKLEAEKGLTKKMKRKQHANEKLNIDNTEEIKSKNTMRV